MKRNSLSTISLAVLLILQAVSFRTFADNIDLAKAKSVGAYYISLVKGTKAAEPQDVRLVYQITNNDLNVAAAYCFNIEGNSFVIVAGNEAASPIIGFSEHDTINPDNMPPQMKVWLEQYCEPIINIQNAKVAPAEDAKKEWDALVNRSLEPFNDAKDFVLLLTDKWGQGENITPTYNALCPQDAQGRYALVGCVGTAMSQIIRYWQYPRKGQNSIFYVTAMGDIDVNFSAAYYEYELMPDVLSTASSQDMIDATALLCYHAGASMKMDYGVEASGAVTYNPYTQQDYLAQSLKKYFKYPNAKTYRRSNFTTQKWIDTLNNEITNGRPMVYCAVDLDPSSGKDAAHAFVCDGKRTVNGADKYHINWGWDGMSNGWFDMTNSTTSFNPSGTPYNFTSNHEITIHFEPPVDSLLSINDINADVILEEAYPNPTSSHIIIPFSVTKNTTLQIVNMQGIVMKTVELRPENAAIAVSVANFPKGIYIYRTNGKAHKFIVQ